MEKNFNIIEIEDKEFVVCDELNIDDKKYWLLAELMDDESIKDDIVVARVEDDMVCGIEDEKEMELVRKEIDKRIAELKEDLV